jgi:hypothetical protein
MRHLLEIPIGLGNLIKNHCMEMAKGANRPEDKRRIQDGCKTIRKRWLEVEDFARRKPHIIQKAVSAQLQLYKEDLKKKHEKEKKILARAAEEKNERMRLEGEESTEKKTTTIDKFLEGGCPEETSAKPVRIENRLCCFGRRCHMPPGPTQEAVHFHSS